MATTAGPATRDAVKAALKVSGSDQDSEIDRVVEAVNDYVAALPVATPNPVDPDPWPARVVQGAVMLATRLHRRRLSPAGVEAFGSEGPVYVQRNDPDVALLLGLGSYAKPAVG